MSERTGGGGQYDARAETIRRQRAENTLSHARHHYAFRHIIWHVHRKINAKRSHYGSFFARKTTAIGLSLYYHPAILDIDTLLSLIAMNEQIMKKLFRVFTE